MVVRDRSFIRGGWAIANGVGVIPFCAPENRGLHKIVQPFLRRHVFLCTLISVPQKRNNNEGINNRSNITYHQNDGITNQHNMVCSCPLTLEKKSYVLLVITQYHCPLIHCLKS